MVSGSSPRIARDSGGLGLRGEAESIWPTWDPAGRRTELVLLKSISVHSANGWMISVIRWEVNQKKHRWVTVPHPRPSPV